jgi:LPXTG-motif cell wall-anchored protein
VSRRARALVAVLIAALMLCAVPAALAGSGPSAGDNQYVDPLAGTHTTSGASSTTNTASAPSTASPTPAPAVSSAAPVTSTPDFADPSGTTTTTTADPSGKLPRTGYDAWLIAALGAALAAGGIAIRRRSTAGPSARRSSGRV